MPSAPRGMAAGGPTVYATRHATAHNVDPIDSWLQELGLGQHTAAFRDNDIHFVRAPRPTELDYRDPALPEEP